MFSGVFYMRDTSWGSLYCRGEMKIKDGIIVGLYYGGSPRSNGDGWYPTFSAVKLGDVVTEESINNCLKTYSGKCKVSGEFIKM